MQFPTFKYHPNPVDTGAFREESALCICCKENTPYIYALRTSPLLTEGSLCPICIHTGRANQELGVEFTHGPTVSDYGRWPIVTASIVDEISTRTPAFPCIQKRWWTHCEEGGVYLGQTVGEQILEYGDDVLSRLRESEGLEIEDWVDETLPCLLGGVMHAQLFACPTCDCIGGYVDCS